MCIICETAKKSENYDFSITSYNNGKRAIHSFCVRYETDVNEYILYLRSDDDNDYQILPILYCPFCGYKLQYDIIKADNHAKA